MLRTRIVALLLGTAMLPSAALADTLLENINGVTLDTAGKTVTFNGLVFDADGTIVQILRSGEKRPKKIDTRYDGGGRYVMPGIIDSHVSLMKIGYTAMTGGRDGLPAPRPEDRDVALQKAQRLLAAQGITAVADMGTSIEDWQTYRRAGDKNTLYIRVMSYARSVEDMVLIGGPGPTPWLYKDKLRFNGVFLKQNASASSMAAPNSPEATQLRNLMSRAAIDTFQIAAVSSDKVALDNVLDAITELKQTYQGERRWRLEALKAIDSAQTGRAAEDKAIVTFRFGALEQDITNAGPTAALVQPWQSVLQAGIKPVYGSGAQNTPPTPFADLAVAMTRENASAQPTGGWYPQERLAREAALSAFTANGAFAGYAEGRFGRLIKGEKADFIMVDRDPMLASASELRAMRVIETWVGGTRIYVAGAEAKQQAASQEKMPGW
jgi:hypothetical protein